MMRSTCGIEPNGTPLQGYTISIFLKPRAMPWAGMELPLRGEEKEFITLLRQNLEHRTV